MPPRSRPALHREIVEKWGDIHNLWLWEAAPGAPPPPPIEEVGCLAGMFAGGAAKSRALAAEVKAAADRLGVPFLDAGRVVQVSPVDGIHYGPEANPALAEAFAAAIHRHFPG